MSKHDGKLDEFKNRFDILRRRRKELKLTLRALAEIVGVSYQAVADWENGESVPSEENWFVLKQTLGLPGNVEDYFGRAGHAGKPRLYNGDSRCFVPGCADKPVAKGMCRKHYMRARYLERKDMDPSDDVGPTNGPPAVPALEGVFVAAGY